jgi:hypothetical protein
LIALTPDSLLWQFNLSNQTACCDSETTHAQHLVCFSFHQPSAMGGKPSAVFEKTLHSPMVSRSARVAEPADPSLDRIPGLSSFRRTLAIVCRERNHGGISICVLSVADTIEG